MIAVLVIVWVVISVLLIVRLVIDIRAAYVRLDAERTRRRFMEDMEAQGVELADAVERERFRRMASR